MFEINLGVLLFFKVYSVIQEDIGWFGLNSDSEGVSRSRYFGLAALLAKRLCLPCHESKRRRRNASVPSRLSFTGSKP